MLIYGPPGTGKTTVAKSISGALGVPLITVTASDFLGQGEAGMENRAKLVFEVLKRQLFSVVLFDEFDQFLLDRDSTHYEKLDSGFKFLTPGMLTKIADLRDNGILLFIVATNYEERIDPAIKRAGRIDLNYLLLPPDRERRMKIMENLKSIGSHVKNADAAAREQLAMFSAFLGFKEIERISKQRWVSLDQLIQSLKEEPRNIQFKSYRERFRSQDNKIDLDSGPRQELILLFRLAKDAWPNEDEWGKLGEDFVCASAFSTELVEKLFKKDAEEASRKKFVTELRAKKIRVGF